MRDIKPEMADFLPMEESEMKRDQQTGEYLCDGCGTLVGIYTVAEKSATGGVQCQGRKEADGCVV